ncbi:MAG TPA: serine hydrolase domain-containing protein [Acidimicrobiales bacterium]|nr:serine hydrolase domain-containing protein [Acidimicrobiales bacterium]
MRNAGAAVLLAMGLVRPSVGPRPLDARSANAALVQALNRYHVAGGAITLLEHGHVTKTVVAGVADRWGDPVQPTTRFEVGSLSKTPAAVTVLRLVDKGELPLDRPLTIPGWAGGSDPLTLRRLLDHTAGLSVVGYRGDADPRPVPTLAAAIAGGDGEPAVREVHRQGRFHYSGGGYALSQDVAEHVDGRPFAQLAAAEVLGPAGMAHSDFGGGVDAADVAEPFANTGRPVPLRRFTEVAPEGLVTTSSDYARLLARLLGAAGGRDPTPILSPALARQVLQAQPGTRGADGLTRRSAYGLGAFLAFEPGHDVTMWHPGVNPGWAAMFAVDPVRGDGIVVVTNSDSGILAASDLVCAWTRAGPRAAPRVCGVVRRGTETLFVTSTLCVVALGLSSLWSVGVLVRYRRRALRTSRSPLAIRRTALLFVPGALVAVGETDVATRWIWGDEIRPVWLLPRVVEVAAATFIAAFVVWVVLAMLRPPPPVRRRSIRLLLAGALAGSWWTPAAATLVLGTDEVIPARAAPRLLTALVAVALLRLVATARPAGELRRFLPALARFRAAGAAGARRPSI